MRKKGTKKKFFLFLLVVLVADSTQVTLSDDAKKALSTLGGDWPTKQLQVQTVFYTATNEAESLLAGISIHLFSLSFLTKHQWC
jgi:hypothetical protein